MEQGGEQNDHIVHLSPEAFSVSPLVASIIAERHRRRPRRPGTMCTVHDNKSPGYGWLLPGWGAEERHMLSGRVYRYYYDPSGRLYYTLAEVLRAWEEAGLILLDK
ncbi:hypothetical protein L484_010746 [Morus notabilis]|uniref:MBD domain-containing protein n=1 Tax=Morus notabilis TaxID=981085 RepID=W9SVN1_9ROSA|nr:hypothetical protein L484_010746 [Morus notabilis]